MVLSENYLRNVWMKTVEVPSAPTLVFVVTTAPEGGAAVWSGRLTDMIVMVLPCAFVVVTGIVVDVSFSALHRDFQLVL